MQQSCTKFVRLAGHFKVLRRIVVALIIFVGLAPAHMLLAAAIVPVATDLTSNADRMISYRHQERMWQTDDGALHLVVNRGTLAPSPGLGLHSSFDGGLTWQAMMVFVDSDASSTVDGMLVGAELSLVYATAGDAVVFVQASYDSLLRTWSLTRRESAYASPQVEAINPALAIDANGRVWCGFVAREKRSRMLNIRLVLRDPDTAVWSDTGLIFGPTDKESKERSARPVRIADGMGMVYRVHETTHWATRSNGLAPAAPWSIATVHVGVPQKPLADPYASHFGVVADDSYNLHMVLVNNANAYYFHKPNAEPAWSAPRQLDSSRKAGYVQIGLPNGKVVVGLSANSGAGGVLVSGDGGNSFTLASDLLVPIEGPGITYKTPRLEMPSRSAGTLPLLQQYADNGLQRLLLYTAPPP